MKTLRVGSLGGTFDPIHNGHLHVARRVRRLFSLDEIWFLIARTPPHKKSAGIAAEWHRCSMVTLATENEARFKICHRELSADSGYTIDTLRALRRELAGRPRFYFIAGGDALRDLPKWHCFEALLEEFPMIFVQRPDSRGGELPTPLDPRVAARVRPYRAGDRPWEQGSFLVNVGAPDISSTAIRTASNSRSIAAWVPPEVYRYIRKYRLYEKP